MNGTVCPCGVCEKRFVGCHAECEVFKTWQEQQNERRKKLYQHHARNDLLNDFKAKSIQKSRRKKRR